MTLVRLSGGFADGWALEVSELDSGLLPDEIEVPVRDEGTGETWIQRYARPATRAIKGTPVYTFSADQSRSQSRRDGSDG